MLNPLHIKPSAALICASLCTFAPLRASAEEPAAAPPEEVEEAGYEGETARTKTRKGRAKTREEGRAGSRVEREDLEIRLARSAPDALRYEPGVFVQQTAHSQGSAFIRGRTGQQTVMLFDGVRLNNSLFRQGPNQYFFTIDSRTIDHIDVLRGSASTRWGSDAISGVIEAVPIEPSYDPNSDGFVFKPRVMTRVGSADGEWGGRLQLDAQLGPHIGIVGGVGWREVGQLESGGIVYNLEPDPRTGERIPQVPRFEDDERTQIGTGFKEFTADLRAVGRIGPEQRVVLGYYDYRQLDAPRTDQCPAPFAPRGECFNYDEQFRTLIYGAVEGKWGVLAQDSRLVLSYQRQHERRSLTRPRSFVLNGGRDDVETLGLTFKATTKSAALGEHVRLRGRYGLDYYKDRVSSAAWLIFTDLDITRERSRGQYIEGSTYGWGGAFIEAEVELFDRGVVRAGGRASHIVARSPADAESGTLPIDASWSPLVANVGLEWWAADWLTVLANADQGFRAPNLDDLTSRQSTGPGFQIENAALGPESGWTYELGARALTRYVQVDAWGYRGGLNRSIARVYREAADCPPNTPQCSNSWSRLQLVNVDGEAVIWGAEGGVKLFLPHNIQLGATAGYAWGESPNPQPPVEGSAEPYQETLPLSRVPPLNGTAEVLWRAPHNLYLGAGLRWARSQTRLALQDQTDGRIPNGGTPGFAVVDLRAGWRHARWGHLALVAENLADEAYRYHGSSVNGAGRSITAELSLGF
jgi:iron complex outermembrane receptor protein/hemoglobin/transferrin/lactoferrin receptor protein